MRESSKEEGDRERQCVYIYVSFFKDYIFSAVYIHIYIFTNLISASIHGTRKNKKKTRQEQEITVSRITAQREKEKIRGQKERKGQGIRSQWSKEN